MHGILKSQHQKLCNCLAEVKNNQSFQNQKLTELELEWLSVFNKYQDKLNEIKQLIFLYEEKQKSILREIKRIKKNKSIIPEEMKKCLLLSSGVTAQFFLQIW